MTTPSVPDFIAGYAPQQPDFQSYWTGPSTFFADRIIARVSQQSSTTSIPDSGTATTILFDTVLEDPYSGWDASTHSWVAPAGYSGWYMATLRVAVTGASANTALSLQFSTSYQTYPNLVYQAIPGEGVASVSQYVYLIGGQDGIAGLAAIHNSGSALSTVTTTGLYPAMEVVWIMS